MTEFSAAKLRDLIASGDVDDVLPHAVLVQDERMRRVLSFAEINCDPSDVAQDVVTAAATDVATNAARDGSDSLMGYLSGLTQQSIDSSQLQALMELLGRVRRDGYLATFFGRTDNGKTNVGLLMAELAMLDSQAVHLVTNITSVQGSVPESRLHVVESYPELDRTVEQLAEFGKKPFVLLDEFSSHGSGYSADRGDVEESMRRFVRKAAKTSSRVVVLGHDGQDVHPTVREFGDDILMCGVDETTGIVDDDYTPTYWVEFYESIENRDPQDLVLRLDDVPKTSFTYNPDEFTSWSWD